MPSGKENLDRFDIARNTLGVVNPGVKRGIRTIGRRITPGSNTNVPEVDVRILSFVGACDENCPVLIAT